MDKDLFISVAVDGCGVLFVMCMSLVRDMEVADIHDSLITPDEFAYGLNQLELAEASMRRNLSVLRRHGISQELEDKIQGYLSELGPAVVAMRAKKIRMDMDLKEGGPPAAPVPPAQEGT